MKSSDLITCQVPSFITHTYLFPFTHKRNKNRRLTFLQILYSYTCTVTFFNLIEDQKSRHTFLEPPVVRTDLLFIFTPHVLVVEKNLRFLSTPVSRLTTGVLISLFVHLLSLNIEWSHLSVRLWWDPWCFISRQRCEKDRKLRDYKLNDTWWHN